MLPRTAIRISHTPLCGSFLVPQLGSLLAKRNYASDEPVDFSKIKIPKEKLADHKKHPEYFGPFRVGHEESFGDYPALKWIAHDQRDPYATYDDPAERRNFGEILHAEDEILSAHGPATYHPESLLKSALKIAGFIGALGALWLLAKEVATRKEPPLASTDYDYPDYIGNKELERLLKEKPFQ